jgi:hypothetical protein
MANDEDEKDRWLRETDEQHQKESREANLRIKTEVLRAATTLYPNSRNEGERKNGYHIRCRAMGRSGTSSRVEKAIRDTPADELLKPRFPF